MYIQFSLFAIIIRMILELFRLLLTMEWTVEAVQIMSHYHPERIIILDAENLI